MKRFGIYFFWPEVDTKVVMAVSVYLNKKMTIQSICIDKLLLVNTIATVASCMENLMIFILVLGISYIAKCRCIMKTDWYRTCLHVVWLLSKILFASTEGGLHVISKPLYFLAIAFLLWVLLKFISIFSTMQRRGIHECACEHIPSLLVPVFTNMHHPYTGL